jgi:hypothetical protein
MRLTEQQLRRTIRRAIVLQEWNSGISVHETRLFSEDDELVPELWDISQYGPRYQGSEHVAVGYLEESPFLSEKQASLIKSINSDPQGSYSKQWEYQVKYNSESGDYEIYDYTVIKDWGTSVNRPKGNVYNSNKNEYEESEVIDWIADASHAALEFAVSHEMTDKDEFGYAEPGHEYTERD